MKITQSFINEFCEQLKARLVMEDYIDPAPDEIIKVVKKTFEGIEMQNELPPLPIDMGEIFPNIRGVNPPDYPLL